MFSTLNEAYDTDAKSELDAFEEDMVRSSRLLMALVQRRMRRIANCWLAYVPLLDVRIKEASEQKPSRCPSRCFFKDDNTQPQA